MKLSNSENNYSKELVRLWEQKDGDRLDWEWNVIDAKNGLNNYKNCKIELLLWKFLPFSFVIYCLQNMIINAADGFIGFFLHSWQRRDHPPISWQERMNPGGRLFTNLRFIVISTPVFNN